jgi:phage/plasmid-like protein (TIGR03299 family)
MPHNLFKDQMAWVGEAPWHGLGKRVPPNVDAEQMIKAASLDWKVTKQPASGARLDKKRGIYDRYLLARDPFGDETAPVALGMVKAGYEVLQNVEAFRFFQPFIDKGHARFESAGALGNGERVWVLAKLVESISVTKSDLVERFLLLSSSHDGRGAVSIRFTPIRVVCQNTLNWAMEGGKAAVAVRHTKNISSNLIREQADKLQMLTEKVYADASVLFHRMAARRIDQPTMSRYLNAVFPRTKRQQRAGEIPVRWSRIEYILNDESVTPTDTHGTLWSLYNAVTRDEDYRVTTEASQSARLERVWFGRGERMKLKALAEARQLLAASA